jgi:hypothetical protein
MRTPSLNNFQPNLVVFDGEQIKGYMLNTGDMPVIVIRLSGTTTIIVGV